MSTIEDIEFLLKRGTKCSLEIDGLTVIASFTKPFFHLSIKSKRTGEDIYVPIRTFNSIQGLDEELYNMLGTVLYQRRYNEWKGIHEKN